MAKSYLGGHSLLKHGQLSSHDPAEVRSFSARQYAHEETIRTKEVFDIWLDQLLKTGSIEALPSNVTPQLKSQILSYETPFDWLKNRHDFSHKAIPKIAKQILMGNQIAKILVDQMLTELQKTQLRNHLLNELKRLIALNDRDERKIASLEVKIEQRKNMIRKMQI